MNRQIFIIFIMLTGQFSQAIVTSSGPRMWDIAPEVQQDLLTIESKVCAFAQENALDLSGVFTMLDLLQREVCTVESQVDVLSDTTSIIDEAVDVTLSKVCAIETAVSLIDVDLQEIEQVDLSGVFTALDQLNQTLCDAFGTFDSEIDIVDSKVDFLTEQDMQEFLNTLTALQELALEVMVTLSLVDEVTASLVEDVQGLTSQMDIANSCLLILESKIDILDDTYTVGFDGTFTALDATQMKAELIESLITSLQLEVLIDLDGTFTALQAIDNKLETIQSDLDMVDSNVINSVSLLDTINAKLDIGLMEICSVEDALAPLASTIEVLSTKADQLADDVLEFVSQSDAVELFALSMLEKLCTIESAVPVLTSEVDAATSSFDGLRDVVITIESNLDMVQLPDIQSKLCLLDSVVDVTQELSLSLLDNVLVLESQTDLLESAAEGVASKAEVAESALCIAVDDAQTVASLIGELESQVCIVDGSIISLESRLDQIVLTDIASRIEVFDSKIQVTQEVTLSVDSKLNSIESLTDELDLVVRNVEVDLASVQEKIDDLLDDFQETWTVLLATELAICTLESKVEAISLPDTLAVDLSGIFTVIDAMLEKACTIESKIASSIVTATTIEPIDISGTFTVFNEIERKLETIESKVDTTLSVTSIQDCFGVPIGQADVGTTGFTINTSGKYYLKENITFSPSVAADAILIDTDNVRLDLNQRTLRQGNSVAGVVGINVSSTLEDIQIINGVVDNFQDGINVNQDCTNIGLKQVTVRGTQAGESIAFGTGCSAILIDQVDASSNGSAVNGLEINGTTGSPSANITITNSQFHDNSADGLMTGTVSRMIIRECMNFNNGGDGISIAEGNEVVIAGCTSISNSGVGIDLDAGSNNSIASCVVRSNGSHGIRLRGQTNSEAVTNVVSLNTGNGIELALGSAGTVATYIFQNSMVQNSINLNEEAGVGPNSILGNYGFNSSGASGNYALSTTITYTVIISQTTGMPATAPSFWENVSMVP